MGTLTRDLRHGLRMLLNKPGFSATAVIVLALGIGANTAVFSLVNAFLLKPLTIQKPEELVGCYSRNTQKPGDYRAFSYPNYVDLRDGNAVFSSLMAHNPAMIGVAEGDTTRRSFADIVSSNYFSTFGVPLFRGRSFSADEERPGSGTDVVIVSYKYWNKTGRDPDLLGKTLRINSRILTVIGITAEGFTGTTALFAPEFFMPLSLHDAMTNDFEGLGRRLASRDYHALILVGRLRSGMNEKSAGAQLPAVASRIAKAYPGENKDQTFIVRPLSRMSISTNPVEDNMTVPVVLLVSMASVVLLIASLNVANMMLARGAARRKEIAIRLALGGARRKILQQLFTEGLILALAGGAAGLVLAYWGTTVLVHSLARLAPLDLVYNAGPDLRVLAATMGFCLLSTILFGLAPGWSLSKSNVVSGLKDGEHEDIAGGKRQRLFSRRNVLVMSQISLSLVLLTAAGLFIRSAGRAANVEPGFRLDRNVLVEVDPSLAGYDEAHGRQTFGRLLDRLAGIPGVETVSLAGTVPFGMVSLGRDIGRASDPPPAASNQFGKGTLVPARFNIVGPDYFKTLGIPLLQGRPFVVAETAGDTKSAVAILDKAAAARLWPHEGAVGKHIRMMLANGTKSQDAEVVGVVGDVQDHIFQGSASEPHLYVPFGQEYQADMNIHLKVAVQGKDDEARLLKTIRGEIRSLDNRLPVLALKTFRQHLDTSFDLWIARAGAQMFSIFGAIALLMAVVGLYGVRAYTVTRRTREIGIRMALGADAWDTLRMILGEGLVITSIGAGIGVLLSVAVGKLLGALLYKVSGADPVVFLTAPILLSAISLLACYLPARNAARVDPMVALRSE